MKFDIDQLIDGLDPWDLRVTIGGVEYAIRPIAVGEMAKGSKTEFASLFKGDAPDREKLAPDAEVAVMAAIGEYLQERARKNFPVLADKAKTAGNQKRASI